jgi:hypothetical protein
LQSWNKPQAHNIVANNQSTVCINGAPQHILIPSLVLILVANIKEPSHTPKNKNKNNVSQDNPKT